jgi:Fe2+ transport system protein B
MVLREDFLDKMFSNIEKQSDEIRRRMDERSLRLDQRLRKYTQGKTENYEVNRVRSKQITKKIAAVVMFMFMMAGILGVVFIIGGILEDGRTKVIKPPPSIERPAENLKPETFNKL